MAASTSTAIRIGTSGEEEPSLSCEAALALGCPCAWEGAFAWDGPPWLPCPVPPAAVDPFPAPEPESPPEDELPPDPFDCVEPGADDPPPPGAVDDFAGAPLCDDG